MQIPGQDEEAKTQSSSHQLSIEPTWEVVGPFPSGMREHPFIATPLHAYPRTTFPDDPDVDFARRPYTPTETWPSELAEGGKVGWKKFETGQDGYTEVFYPDIKWDQLRSDHGWASLQYQALLRTTITIPHIDNLAETRFLIDVIQGTEYAFIPIHRQPEIPTTWYNGDVYNFASSPSGRNESTGKTSNLARSISLPAGMYTLLVRAAYETRLFGDPKSSSRPERGPVIRLKVQAEVQETSAQIIGGSGVVPDLLDGWFLGEWMSVALRGGNEDVMILADKTRLAPGVELEVLWDTCVRAGQVRCIPFKITQTTPLDLSITKLEIPLITMKDERTPNHWRKSPLYFKTQLRQIQSRQGAASCRMTFASPFAPSQASPASISYAMIITPFRIRSIHSPPSKSTPPPPPPVILALHGAGVDAASPEWSDVIPKRENGWAVLPTGRTEWGEDWHGGSMADAWAARDALPGVLAKLGCTVSSETLLMGHSNGGQGAWHLAARYPDRIVGVIAASGWLTIQDYVPYTEQVSNHHADPALMGILKSSLTPYDNDLHASNLVGIPILAIHGSDDDNVTPRHSRAHVALVAAHAGSEENLTFLEIPKKGHYWSDIFKQPKVIKWMKDIPAKIGKRETVLSCANPLEGGGREGRQIVELEMPGRLGKIAHVDVTDPDLTRATNVRKISHIDEEKQAWALNKVKGRWQAEQLNQPATTTMRAYGPMIRLLATEAVFTIVYGNTPRLKHLAHRLAHDLLVYHRIDSELLDGNEGETRVAEGKIAGSLVCLGRADENELVDWMIKQDKIPVTFPLVDTITLDGQRIRGAGTGLITLHPHPCRLLGLAVIIAGNDDLGLELAARLFPNRTGVMVSDWAAVHPSMRWKGAGGLLGAGFYGNDWRYNGVMSWLDGRSNDTSWITQSRKRPRP